MKQILDLFEERYAQSVIFNPCDQPSNWRTWDGYLIEHNITKPGAALNISPNQLFRFDEERPGEGHVRHVGRVTPHGIYIVLREQEGVRAIVSTDLMTQVMKDTQSDPDLDPIHYILTNY